ncbi:MAG: hypothetical protein BWY17_04873 [Deltaproteobacteria bacterium ADurb.Bin207]|jgi:hypothetical protein|nr:MAG: hypothetical protein BWY17_04873 [Deltaproteobacteria bacterium ADurb.Bin207]
MDDELLLPLLGELLLRLLPPPELPDEREPPPELEPPPLNPLPPPGRACACRHRHKPIIRHDARHSPAFHPRHDGDRILMLAPYRREVR